MKDRLTLFFDTNTYNIINTKQKEYIQTHKKNPLIYKIRYRQLCLCLDFNLIDQFLQRMPAKYQAVLKLKYEQGYTLAKISLRLNISKSGIIKINRKMTDLLMNIIFCDIKQLFMEKLNYEMFMILLNMLSSLRYKLREEISFLLRNNIYVDTSYDYLKNLYKKEKLLLK
ncbi:sigma factor-like helix-turn-helix DNA-binding protein, partial [Megamonas funiformis]